jgi:hypothetical protein
MLICGVSALKKVVSKVCLKMTESCSSMLRPICRRLPATISIWDDTNLPLSCVVTPLCPIDQQNSKVNLCKSSSNPMDSNPVPLATIIKCLCCGAPHPSKVTHFPFHRKIICHLCGKTSSSHFEDQAMHRHEEPLIDSKDCFNSKFHTSKSGETLEFSIPLSFTDSSHPIYQVPAMNCPPIWWIVIEGSPSRSYWNILASALAAVISELPPYIHIGLLLVSSSNISVWNVTSAIPFIQHYSFPDGIRHRDFILADVGTYQSHIQATMRAMGDSILLTEGNVPIAQTLELILDHIQDGGVHPGQILKQNSSNPRKNQFQNQENSKSYAGGRVLMILNGPPHEFLSNSVDISTSRKIGLGGQGGACFEHGLRFTTNTTPDFPESTSDDPEMGLDLTAKSEQPNCDFDDLRPRNLERLFPKVDHTSMNHLQQLGQSFAEAAFGIDILVLQHDISPNLGLPLLNTMCELTGTPGPIVVDLNQQSADELIQNELWARVPVSFGGLLRIRSSPGFKLDSSPVQGVTKSPLDLAKLQIRNGLMGPAAATGEESLWKMGCCDPHQTVTLDFNVTNKVQRFVYVEGVGDVTLKPCIQACFAYTTVIPEFDGNSTDYFVVRRLRICSLHLPLANDVESFYVSLDPEALTIVLSHKFTTSVLTEGIIETQRIGRDWLKFILICVYRSAEEALKKEQQNSDHGLSPEGTFFAADRLLNSGSSLSRDDILLAQGHATLQVLPLVVWCLLQCDAIRPSSGAFRPTLDVRSAALSQMTCMAPHVLARCLAPRIELWQSGNDIHEPILSKMGLSFMDLEVHVKDHQQADSNLILFFDSPYGILVCDGRHVSPTEITEPVIIGEALVLSIQQAVDSYRTPPSITWALDVTTSIHHLLVDYLMEDSRTYDEGKNFQAWKQDIAESIFQELMNDDEY